MEKLVGFLSPLIVALLVFFLNAVLPGRWVKGYIQKPGSQEKMDYHLNGIIVFFVIILLWFTAGYFKIIPFDWLYQARWYGLAGACFTGIVFSLVIVLSYPAVRKSLIADLFLGRIENLQYRGGRVDAKMFLYLFGAIMLELNVLSFTSHHLISFGEDASPGIFISAFLITFFVIDYLVFEEIHLYTYDIFAERVGFKLGWGCLVFYPYFYLIPIWAVVDLPKTHAPTGIMAIYVLIFISGWMLSRGANMQKYYFKKYPGRKFLWISPETISDGEHKLLVNGWWGKSRHINYLGEIIMATGIALSVGYPMLFWPWLYPLYYILLLIPRQVDDEKRCQKKYGDLWKTYRQKVKYRIIPYIY